MKCIFIILLFRTIIIIFNSYIRCCLVDILFKFLVISINIPKVANLLSIFKCDFIPRFTLSFYWRLIFFFSMYLPFIQLLAWINPPHISLHILCWIHQVDHQLHWIMWFFIFVAVVWSVIFVMKYLEVFFNWGEINTMKYIPPPGIWWFLCSCRTF